MKKKQLYAVLMAINIKYKLQVSKNGRLYAKLEMEGVPNWIMLDIYLLVYCSPNRFMNRRYWRKKRRKKIKNRSSVCTYVQCTCFIRIERKKSWISIVVDVIRSIASPQFTIHNSQIHPWIRYQLPFKVTVLCSYIVVHKFCVSTLVSMGLRIKAVQRFTKLFSIFFFSSIQTVELFSKCKEKNDQPVALTWNDFKNIYNCN